MIFLFISFWLLLHGCADFSLVAAVGAALEAAVRRRPTAAASLVAEPGLLG